LTALPPDAALYHAQAKLFKRSEGRSAVAAAAYRSASLLHDERTGQDFDYRKKHAVAAFIVAPAGAPAWASDRQEVWNRAERAERRRDAKVAREWEISIPRDIPRDQWESFARAVVAPYVAAGAIADVAIHCPRAADGEAQPHIHVMLTLRETDPTTESGFAVTRNSELESMHAVGSRKAGDRGDAIKVERERIAEIMNRYLAEAGSPRRVSHLSNAARGLDSEPEPTMGEQRKHAATKRQKHDRVTALVGSMRRVRTLENQLSQTEEEIMATSPKFQALKGGIRPARKQDFKAKLMRDRFPDLPTDADWPNKIHMVDVRQSHVTKIHTRDGGWVEVEGRQIKTYGQRGYADALALQIGTAIGADDIERLEEMQSIQRKGSGIRARRRPGDPAPQVPAAEVESRADRWRSRGYTDITEASDGTWISIGACRLQDLGNEVRIHGKPTDAAARALLAKAIDEWDSEIEIYGSREFKDSVWREAQRQGVKVYDKETGSLYEPSPDVRKAFEADAARNAENVTNLEGVRNHKAIAGLVRESAAGDVAALAKLENNDPALVDFVTLHLDDDQRARLASKPESDIVDALSSFREYGREAREKDDERRGTGKRPTSIPSFDDFMRDDEMPAQRAALNRAMARRPELDEEDLRAEIETAEAEQQGQEQELPQDDPAWELDLADDAVFEPAEKEYGDEYDEHNRRPN
jgi:hypothetical protein